MLVTRTSIYSNITRTLDLPIRDEDYMAWRGGMLIQDAMPYLSSDEREFLMTGITAEEWEGIF
jgi:hypothetical protein